MTSSSGGSPPLSSSLDTSGIVLNSVCAFLFGTLAMGALFRLVHRHRTSGFPFGTPKRLSQCARCMCSVCARIRTRLGCFCRDGAATDDGSGDRQRLVVASASSNYVHGYLSPRGGGGVGSPYFVPSASKGARKGYLVMVSLLSYGVLRCIQLSLFASSTLDSSGDVRTNIYRFFPALGFMALQSAMLAKWVDHVSELTLALQNQAFGVGPYLIRCSALMLCAEMAITACAVVDTEAVSFSHQPPHFWNVLMNMFCGVVYAFNGMSFAGLGCFLWHLWVPVTPMGVHASRRILGIALVFGLMSVTRGAILLMYIDDTTDSQGRIRDVTHNDWGAPAVLLVEWCCLVVSLFLLTVAKSHNNSTLQQTTIGSSMSFLNGADPTAKVLEQRRRDAAATAAGASSSVGMSSGTANLYSRPTLSDISMQQHSRIDASTSSPPLCPSGLCSAVVSPRDASARSLRMAMMRGAPRQGLSSSVSSATRLQGGGSDEHQSSPVDGVGAAAPRNPPNSIQGGSVRSLPPNP